LVKVLPVIVYWELKSAVAAVRVTWTVPVPVRVPAPLIIFAAEGVKVELEPRVKVPATAKLLLPVTVAELAVVRLKNVSEPELVIEAPLFMVIVPAVGVKVPVTFRDVSTEASLVPVVTEPEIFKVL
jgi:hypothetical protein